MSVWDKKRPDFPLLFLYSPIRKYYKSTVIIIKLFCSMYVIFLNPHNSLVTQKMKYFAWGSSFGNREAEIPTLFLKELLYLFIYFWLCWVFVSVRGLSLVAASGGHSSSRCVGLSLSRPLLLRSTGSRRADSVIVAHGLSCSAACGIFPDEGLNPCPLHWQADSQPLHHQGSPEIPTLDSCAPEPTILSVLRCS